jgi:hypothetical protein
MCRLELLLKNTIRSQFLYTYNNNKYMKLTATRMSLDNTGKTAFELCQESGNENGICAFQEKIEGIKLLCPY